MMRPSVQGVDPPVCCTPGCYCYICKRQLCGFPQCAASWMTYARDSFVDSQGGLLSSRGGGPRHIGTDTLAPVLQLHPITMVSFLFKRLDLRRFDRFKTPSPAFTDKA